MAIQSILNKWIQRSAFVILLSVVIGTLMDNAFAESKCPKGTTGGNCRACQKKGHIWNSKKKLCEGMVIPKDAPKVKVPASTDEIPPNRQDDL